MKKLIDISHHNGNIDFGSAMHDIDGVIIRAGYGDSLDRMFIENIEECNRLDIPVGIYWFSYAYSEGMAQAEAVRCAEAIRNYNVSLPVFFDWEYDSARYAREHGVEPTSELITAMNKAFCEEIQNQGYKAGFYFNEDYRKNWLDFSELDGFYKWYARYISEISVDCDIWQYASDGDVDGIAGNVDMNNLVNENLWSDTPEPQPAPEPQPDPEPTKHYDVYYAVQSQGHTYEEVENDSDFAGAVNGKDPICNLAVRISDGIVRYRAHVLNGDWLPYVYGYNWDNFEYGFAGIDEPIDAIQIETGESVEANIMYRVAPVGGDYYAWVTEDEDYAGIYGNEIGKVQIKFDR